MLKERILNTLKFFDLQDYPLSLLELGAFLIADRKELETHLDEKRELKSIVAGGKIFQLWEILECLEKECPDDVETDKGFYCLKGRMSVINSRWRGHISGIRRERRLSRYAGFLRHIPFVRGAALAGSQAMGPQKIASDIDLLVIADPGFLFLARTLVTFYFQILGLRRHGAYIADRFCLNHYLAGPIRMRQLRNLYTAWEYGKLRPLIYPEAVNKFQAVNADWIRTFFPSWRPAPGALRRQSAWQAAAEKLFSLGPGMWLERKLKIWQLAKIKKQDFIIAEGDELSFHPQSKQQKLLASYFSGGG